MHYADFSYQKYWANTVLELSLWNWGCWGSWAIIKKGKIGSMVAIDELSEGLMPVSFIDNVQQKIVFAIFLKNDVL